jgi:ATP-binding cassette subfamily B protein
VRRIDPPVPPGPARAAFAEGLRGQRGRLVAVSALTAASAAGSLATPALLAAALDAALHVRTNLALWLVGLVILAETGVALLLRTTGASLHARATANLRHRIVDDLLARGLRRIDPLPDGEVLSRLSVDAPGVSAALVTTVEAGISVALLVGALVALALIDWTLVVVFLIGAAALAFVLRTFVGQVTDVFARYRRAQAALSARLVEAMVGARTIRASASLEREVARVLEPVADLSAAGRQTWDVQRTAGWQAQLIFPLLEIAVLATAGFRLAAGAITPAALLAVIGYTQLAMGLFDQVDAVFALGESRASARRAGELLGAPPPGPEATASPTDSALELAGVTVGEDGREVLHDVTLRVAHGECLAVVGASGSGKSTLALVAGGLIGPDAGTVRVGGVPLAGMPVATLRRTVAYAFERPELVGGTVHDAIALGAPDGGRPAVEEAARAAQADDFIRRLPDGYRTPMAQVPLSGGEAQRIGLARAFAQGERLLILDDATASLDTATEARIAAALDRFHGERTCLVVTHRPATAARADRVAWLERGRLRAVGTHDDLWLQQDYRAMFSASPEGAET